MSRTRPDPTFDFMRADEAAECLDIPSVISTFLWNHIVPLQRPYISDPDHPQFEEEPTYHSPLRKYWRHLPEEYRRQLNAAAIRNIRGY
jgi:hypothetical protein